jgi:hypothetical protein
MKFMIGDGKNMMDFTYVGCCGLPCMPAFALHSAARIPRTCARRCSGDRRALPPLPQVGNVAASHLQAADALALDSKLAGQAYFITNKEPRPFWGMCVAPRRRCAAVACPCGPRRPARMHPCSAATAARRPVHHQLGKRGAQILLAALARLRACRASDLPLPSRRRCRQVRRLLRGPGLRAPPHQAARRADPLCGRHL